MSTQERMIHGQSGDAEILTYNVCSIPASYCFTILAAKLGLGLSSNFETCTE